MSSIQMPRVLSQRGKSQYEIERENFERHQATSLQKAINATETPVKEKHVRTVIIGTFQEKSGGLFWAVVTRMPLQDHPITCWKFCNVLHKVLREGHHQVVSDSHRYVGYIKDLGKLWGHLKEGYGKLIAFYTKLLLQKLNFLKKYPPIPGNLMVEDEDVNKLCNNDINTYFELSVDMLDYMDDILNLQAAVFGSLDMSRASSMTSTGQCRLAPLIQCIQDSCQLYDILVKVLFRLHSCLPADTLGGHRDRFNSQYKKLKQFYFSSSNLQYFKNLIKVPSLPDHPPNFLRASDLSSHVRPVAVVPEPEPESQTPETESLVGDLIDTSIEEPVMMAASFNGAPSPPMPDERDQMIERLMREINELKQELQSVKAEDAMMIESLNNRIRELEAELNEMKQIAESTQQENEQLRNLLKENETNAEVSVQLATVEKMAKANEDKFKKMKQIYTDLREEHVKLLRVNAEVKKTLAAEKDAKSTAEKKMQEANNNLDSLKKEQEQIHSQIKESEADVTSQIAAVEMSKHLLQSEKQNLESQMTELESAKAELEDALQRSRNDLDKLRADLEKSSEDQKFTEDQVKQQNIESNKKLLELESAKAELEDALQHSRNDLDVLRADHEKSSADHKLAEDQLKLQNVESNKNLLELEHAKAELEDALQRSRNDFDGLRANLEKSAADHKLAEDQLKLQSLQSNKNLLVAAIEEGSAIIRSSLQEFDDPHHHTVTCTAEYLLHRSDPVLNALTRLTDAYKKYSNDSEEISGVIKQICNFSHNLADLVLQGKATANAVDIEKGDCLSATCRSTGEESLSLLELIKDGSLGTVPGQADKVVEFIKRIMAQAEDLLPKVEDVQAEQLGDMIDQEMQQTTDAIKAAAERISAMLAESRQSLTGIQLEVNERILDSCNGLMKAISVLIGKSKNMQREIVSQGRGSSTAKDFYKKHHRWTEGLISAAKAVGFGANALVEGADKVVKGEGKFEELVVCSQEIAASTTQLVVASKVKADRKSENLKELSVASKGVSEATGQVVASAKTGAQLIEEQDTLDFSKLSLTQAKRLEMNSQVRVLELESDLEKERVRLAELRKKHYQLAGESEGWDVEDQQQKGQDFPDGMDVPGNRSSVVSLSSFWEGQS